MFKAAVLVILLAASICFGFFIEPKTNFDTRIVGGEDAVEGQFPWMISIRFREMGHQCGGSILNSKWILTAAHCVHYNNATEDYTVVAGTSLLSSGGIAYSISRIIVHEDFDGLLIKNDVAVLELVGEIEYTEFTQPIELGTEFVEEVDSVLSGWGRLYFEGPIPEILQYINLRTMTLEDCRKYPTIVPGVIYVSDDEICTMSVLEKFGFCNGDSGGPLVADGKQIGIVSWANPPCAFGLPEVYMRVSSYVEWINKAISS